MEKKNRATAKKTVRFEYYIFVKTFFFFFFRGGRLLCTTEPISVFHSETRCVRIPYDRCTNIRKTIVRNTRAVSEKLPTV